MFARKVADSLAGVSYLPDFLRKLILGPGTATLGRFVALHAPLPTYLRREGGTVVNTSSSFANMPQGFPANESHMPTPATLFRGRSRSMGRSDASPKSDDVEPGADVAPVNTRVLNTLPLRTDSGSKAVLKTLSLTARRNRRTSTSRFMFQTTGFPRNNITTARYNIWTFFPKQMFLQFSKLANLYFLFIAALQQVPGWSPTGQYTTLLPLVLFVGLAMVREAYDDWLRKKRDETENKDITEVLVEDKSGGTPVQWQTRLWQDVQVGDIVRVKKDMAIPADLILLRTGLDQGLCYIQTSQLDGESNLKQRQAIASVHEALESLEELAVYKAFFEAEDPNEDIYNFDGSITLSDHTRIPLTISNLVLRGTTLRNTSDVIGLAIFTGEETKIRMNANQNKHAKVPNLEKLTNRVVLIIFSCVVGLAILSTAASIMWDRVERWYLPLGDLQVNYISTFFTFVILYNTMIPISLYVTLEIVKITQAYFINCDLGMYMIKTDQPAEARTASLNEELGQISYLFSDKTGTLTENSMVFRQMSVGGVEFVHYGDRSGSDVSGSEELAQESLTTLFEQPIEAQQRPEGPKITLQLGLNSSEQELTERLNAFPPTLARSTKNLHNQLSNFSDHPLSLRIAFFIQAIALCHQAIPDIDQTSSDSAPKAGSIFEVPIDQFHSISRSVSNASRVAMEQPLSGTSEERTATKFVHLSYQSASPDEIALVNAARQLGFILTSRTASHMILLRMGTTNPIKYDILDTIEFSSARKRMSIIVRFPEGQVVMISKGADSTMLERSKPFRELSADEQTVLLATRAHLEKFASAGLRTLVYAVRYLNEHEYRRWSRFYLEASTSVSNRTDKLTEAANMIEKNWTIIGATGIEDRLQKGVPDAIQMLGRANIKIWMVTGDKKETAISIGHSSGLIKEDSEILAFEGTNAEGLEVSDEELERKVDSLASSVEAWFDKKSSTPTVARHTIATSKMSGSVPALEASSPTPANFLEAVQAVVLPKASSNSKIVRRNSSMAPPELSELQPKAASSGKNQFVMVVDGPTIARLYNLQGPLFEKFMSLACSCVSVLCCRVSPLQKSLVVKSVRLFKPGEVTAAIGDGANDIAMIQQAHVGIGITGKEGMQAARSSDYSFACFSFLKRLLLVHGHWAYIRVSKFTLGTFYKCIMFYCTQAFFQIYTGYSGTSLYEQWTLTMYNIIFSSLPVILLGVFDRDLPDNVVCDFPELYRTGQRNGEFDTRIFLLWLLKSITQSVIVFFGTAFLQASHYTYSLDSSMSIRPDLYPHDAEGSLYVYGTIAYTAVVLTATIQICFISPATITVPLHVCALVTVALWFLWQGVYSLVWPRFGLATGYEQSGIWWQLADTIGNPSYDAVSSAGLWWAVVLLLMTLGCAPEWTFSKLRRYYMPTDPEKLMEMDVVRRRYEENKQRLQQLVENPLSPTINRGPAAGPATPDGASSSAGRSNGPYALVAAVSQPHSKSTAKVRGDLEHGEAQIAVKQPPSITGNSSAIQLNGDPPVTKGSSNGAASPTPD